MSGIAEVLTNLGYEVTGSDMKESDTTRRLRGMGIRITIGHKAENINGAHVVVISSAVPAHNPEVVAARELSIPVIPRAEMLAELARLKYGILVAGAHGKTTTTSLISTVVGYGGFDPTIIIGGKLKGIGSNARLGKGDFLVAEADESDGSFLKLSPTIAVVTNIDREHMEYFRDMKTLKDAFLSFMNKVPFYGVSFVCLENTHIRELIPYVHRRVLTYGLSEEADIHATALKREFLATSFEVIYRGSSLGRFIVPLPGIHNVLNSLACIGVAIELKMDAAQIREALKSFSGIQRRFEFKGEAAGIRVYDDYGHHPTEIRATISAARESLAFSGPDARLFVMFQPHRYTRTSDLMEEFATSFEGVDRLIILDIYAAGEKPIEGLTAEVLSGKIKNGGGASVSYCPSSEDAVDLLIEELRPGDMLLTLGAGNVWKSGEKIVERLNHA